MEGRDPPLNILRHFVQYGYTYVDFPEYGLVLRVIEKWSYSIEDRTDAVRSIWKVVMKRLVWQKSGLSTVHTNLISPCTNGCVGYKNVYINLSRTIYALQTYSKKFEWQKWKLCELCDERFQKLCFKMNAFKCSHVLYIFFVVVKTNGFYFSSFESLPPSYLLKSSSLRVTLIHMFVTLSKLQYLLRT